MEPSKPELRQRFDRYRRTLDADAYEELSRRAIARLKTLPELQAARVVHVYWPMIESREMDTRPLINWLKEHGKEIVLPVILNFQGTYGEPKRLGHVRFPGEEGLRVNRWGIAEPVDRVAVPVDRLEAVVVPALGAARDGHRIGYGYGYYDEFLAGIAAPKIVLVYDYCLVDHVPSDDHDIPVDVVVTEREVVRPALPDRLM